MKTDIFRVNLRLNLGDREEKAIADEIISRKEDNMKSANYQVIQMLKNYRQSSGITREELQTIVGEAVKKGLESCQFTALPAEKIEIDQSDSFESSILEDLAVFN